MQQPYDTGRNDLNAALDDLKKWFEQKPAHRVAESGSILLERVLRLSDRSD